LVARGGGESGHISGCGDRQSVVYPRARYGGVMTASLPPTRHDTANPLTCCPRCHKAEILGRLRRRPVFRYDKVDATDAPSTYDVYHGDQRVATLRRQAASGSPSYQVCVLSHAGDQELLARTLRDARALAEESYTASWREGAHNARGPVREI
jgi:hypothetical protein